MTRKITRSVAGAALTVAGGTGLALLLLGASRSGAAPTEDDRLTLIGEARQGSITVPIAPALDIAVTEAKAPGRPIVVLDPGHGGRDPGATSGTGEVTEKDLALTLARELRAHLAERGRVRVALTRDGDRYLSLDERARVARHLGASLFVSLHMDSAPNPLARGASVYSLSEVASDAEAAQLAARENAHGNSGDGAGPDLVQAMLSDLALRSQMAASADLALRMVRKSEHRVGLRPEPHRFATFHVLRRAESPAVLFEAGYISNSEDELLLRSPEHRKRLVEALAEAIETDVAARAHR